MNWVTEGTKSEVANNLTPVVFAPRQIILSD